MIWREQRDDAAGQVVQDGSLRGFLGVSKISRGARQAVDFHGLDVVGWQRKCAQGEQEGTRGERRCAPVSCARVIGNIAHGNRDRRREVERRSASRRFSEDGNDSSRPDAQLRLAMRGAQLLKRHIRSVSMRIERIDRPSSGRADRKAKLLIHQRRAVQGRLAQEGPSYDQGAGAAEGER